MHVGNKNRNTQELTSDVVKVISGSKFFPLNFKRSSHFEKGRICRELLLDAVVTFDVINFSAFWLRHCPEY